MPLPGKREHAQSWEENASKRVDRVELEECPQEDRRGAASEGGEGGKKRELDDLVGPCPHTPNWCIKGNMITKIVFDGTSFVPVTCPRTP